jgi:light-regulated signal transduction histidine kinase (bacteriophytochrome)
MEKSSMICWTPRASTQKADFFHRGLRRTLTDAIRNLQSLIEENGAVITRGPLPWVMGDPVRSARLLQNLVVNSIRYRSDEAPCIEIAAERGGDWCFRSR